MSTLSSLPTPALAAYDEMAAGYDAFTEGYDHRKWFAAIHPRARRLGIPGNRALDLACGTGRSTVPLVEAGYCTWGCDISPAMLERAKGRLPGCASRLFAADMRELPDIPPVDFVLCLDDAINYVVAGEQLVDVFRGINRVLVPGGVVAFDLNTLKTYRTSFAQTAIRQTEDFFFVWQGQASAALEAGAVATAHLEIFQRSSDGGWERSGSDHVQRHHPREEVLGAMNTAGLECSSVVGQHRGCGLDDGSAEELQHIKLVYFARRPR